MSARVFSRLLAVAQSIRMRVGDEIFMGLMGMRYTGADCSRFVELEANARPPVYAPGFLRDNQKQWASLAERYLGSIDLGPIPDDGCDVMIGCDVVMMIVPDASARTWTDYFRKFSRLAGTHLPDGALGSYERWPEGPVDRWLTFLWRVGVLNKTDDMVLLGGNPFDASARAIERCRLHTDSPRFRDPESQTPADKAEADQPTQQPDVTKQTAEPPAEGQVVKLGSEAPEVVLCDRKQHFLRALFSLEAFDSDRRKTTAEVAVAAAAQGADANTFKAVVVDLKSSGMVATAKGPGGGVWLTEQGRKRAEKLAKSS